MICASSLLQAAARTTIQRTSRENRTFNLQRDNQTHQVVASQVTRDRTSLPLQHLTYAKKICASEACIRGLSPVFRANSPNCGRIFLRIARRKKLVVFGLQRRKKKILCLLGVLLQVEVYLDCSYVLLTCLNVFAQNLARDFAANDHTNISFDLARFLAFLCATGVTRDS